MRSDYSTLDRLADYSSMAAACRALAPKFHVGAETLRKWIVQAQADADAGNRIGPTSVELEEIRRLKKENKALNEINDVVKAATSFLARELDPLRHPQAHLSVG
jgi:transposase